MKSCLLYKNIIAEDWEKFSFNSSVTYNKIMSLFAELCFMIFFISEKNLLIIVR